MIVAVWDGRSFAVRAKALREAVGEFEYARLNCVEDKCAKSAEPGPPFGAEPKWIMT